MRLGWFAVLALVAACDSATDSPCAKICEREASCIEKLNDSKLKFDSGECTAACKALDRDEEEGRKLVEKHRVCVEQAAGDCDKILACQ